MPIRVPIYEEFDSPTGVFSDYTAYDAGLSGQVKRQKHVDIRSFTPEIPAQQTMFYLDFDTMDDLEDNDMQDLEGLTVGVPAEHWSGGTVAEDASRNHWSIFTWSGSAYSVTRKDLGEKPIDISGFEEDDFISIAFPSYNATAIDEANTYVQFTSNPNPDASNDTVTFDTGPTDTIALSQSVTPLINGDSEFRFPISLLSTVDRSAITGVRFRFFAASTKVAAIRAVSKYWTYLPIDVDTQKKALVRTVPPTGSTSLAAPTDFPTVFKAADLYPGVGDPTPVDLTTYTDFYSGTTGSTEFNYIDLFYREKPLDYLTQLDLEGDTIQDDLDGLPQPDFGQSPYASRPQSTIEGNPQRVIGESETVIDPETGEGLDTPLGGLDGETQFSLDRVQDGNFSAYIKVHIAWNTNDSFIEISDSESLAPPYHWTLNLGPNSYYAVGIELYERTIRFVVWDASPFGQRLTKLHDHQITDTTIFKRRKGRFGWAAQLIDGDAQIQNISPAHQNYGEYRTQAYSSITPVDGAALNVGGTDKTDLFYGIFEGPWGGFFVPNPERSPESFTIKNTEAAPLQGFQTNRFYLDDFKEIDISFQLYIQQAALDGSEIAIFLWNGYQPIPVPYRSLEGDTWNDVSISLDHLEPKYSPGWHSLVVVQVQPDQVTNELNEWSVDKIHVLRRTIRWEGRAYLDDAWGSYQGWVPFNNALNQETGGVVFPDRANAFQIRGKTLMQDSSIGQIRATPKYASLGRFAWPDQETIDSRPLVTIASLNQDVPTLTVDLTANIGSLDSDSYIIAYHWDFGDGTSGTGQTVQHQYSLFSANGYTVQLIATDNNGESYTDIITVFP